MSSTFVLVFIWGLLSLTPVSRSIEASPTSTSAPYGYGQRSPLEKISVASAPEPVVLLSENLIEVKAQNQTIRQGPADDDGVYNALLEGGPGVSNGQQYWQVTIQRDVESLGVTNRTRFQPGYHLKALMYYKNGRLADGAADIQEQYEPFGPPLKQYDIFGIFIRLDNSRIRVYFDINGTSLGLVYDLPRTVLQGGIYPVAQFGSLNGSVLARRVPGSPSLIRPPSNYEGIEGYFRLRELVVNGFTQPIPIQVKLRLTEIVNRADFIVYQGDVKIVNQMKFKLILQGFAGTPSSCCFTITYIFVPPGVAREEAQIGDLVQNPTRVTIISTSIPVPPFQEERLIFEGGSTTRRIQSQFDRYTPAYKPVTQDPFQPEE